MSNLDIFMDQPQLCLVCGKQTLKVISRGIGNGERINVECSSCKSTGRIGNMPPWRGIELTEKELDGLFTLAGIEIIKKWKIKNGYWGSMEDEAHPWWLVKTTAGLIEIGWRERVIEINWSDTNVEAIITTDDVTKSKTMVHAYTESKAVEYLTELARQMRIADLPSVV